jgi:hypothetical protein
MVGRVDRTRNRDVQGEASGGLFDGFGWGIDIVDHLLLALTLRRLLPSIPLGGADRV